MLEGKKLAVVVPAYNEEKLIGRVIETMPAFVDRIYIVDDQSRDRTAQVVEEYAARNPELVHLIRHEINQGVGAAITTGYRASLEDGCEVVAVMAGDAQMDPHELSVVAGPVARGECDYVKGNRLVSDDSWRKIPAYRFFGNAALSLLTKIASGYWQVADSQTGYTAISRRALEIMPIHKLYPRYGYPNHLLVMLNIYNMVVKDVTIKPVYGVGEVSGIRLRKVIPAISALLWRCFWWRMVEKYVVRDFHPLVFFYFFAVILLPAGSLFGGYLFLYRLFVGPVEMTSALFAVFMLVSGLNLLLFAMMFDMEYNRDLKG